MYLLESHEGPLRGSSIGGDPAYLKTLRMSAVSSFSCLCRKHHFPIRTRISNRNVLFAGIEEAGVDLKMREEG